MTKKQKPLKIALIIVAALAAFAILSVTVINLTVVLSAKKHIYTAEKAGEGYDCILILGCGVRNNQPSPMLYDRLVCGIELYKMGAASKLLMSGDNGSADYNEVAVMRDFALSQGVPAEDIFLDHAGFSTYESAYRAKEIFCARRVLIVTQKYHLYRAVFDARALGLDACGVSSDLRPYLGQGLRDVREVLARIKDCGYCIFKPLPTYLGETIPVSGEGNCIQN